MDPIQFRMARAATGAKVREIAEALGISTATVTRFERGGDSRRSTVEALRKFMTARGVTFIDDPGGAVGALYRPPGERT